jgi:hypothetical protein
MAGGAAYAETAASQLGLDQISSGKLDISVPAVSKANVESATTKESEPGMVKEVSGIKVEVVENHSEIYGKPDAMSGSCEIGSGSDICYKEILENVTRAKDAKINVRRIVVLRSFNDSGVRRSNYSYYYYVHCGGFINKPISVSQTYLVNPLTQNGSDFIGLHEEAEQKCANAGGFYPANFRIGQRGGVILTNKLTVDCWIPK